MDIEGLLNEADDQLHSSSVKFNYDEGESGHSNGEKSLYNCFSWCWTHRDRVDRVASLTGYLLGSHEDSSDDSITSEGFDLAGQNIDPQLHYIIMTHADARSKYNLVCHIVIFKAQ
jgi:hypothetical protein